MQITVFWNVMSCSPVQI